MIASTRPVLIVEDDEDIRELVGMALTVHGFRATGVADGEAAWAALRGAPPPALILVDLMMPKMDGAALVRAMHSDPVLSKIPVVVLSGNPAARAQAEALHADGCLMKPVELDELVATVERFVPH